MSDDERGRESGAGPGDDESPVAKWLRNSEGSGHGESPVAKWLRNSEGSGPGSKPANTSASPPGTAGPSATVGGRLRRRLRTARARGFRSLLSLPVVVALLLGITLGGTGALWISERASGDESADAGADGYCWGALSEKNARWFLRDGDQRSLADDVPVRGEESRLRGAEERGRTSHASSAHCRLTAESGRAQLDVTVKVLDRFDAYGTWQRDHLHARLTPMADGLRGMAGPHNAWLALPPECPVAEDGRVPVVSVVGRPGSESRFSGHLEPGSPEYAHAAVSVANAILDSHGCQTSFPVKKEPLLQVEGDGSTARLAETKRGCGLDFKGGLPDRIDEADVVGGQLDGPLRVCEARPEGQETPTFQLVAINDPAVEAAIFPKRHPREPRTMAVPCMQHELSFVGDAAPGHGVPLTKLLRMFAQQEARHHGCDPKKVTERPAGR